MMHSREVYSSGSILTTHINPTTKITMLRTISPTTNPKINQFHSALDLALLVGEDFLGSDEQREKFNEFF